jgi:large subunit ribosomal protein L2
MLNYFFFRIGRRFVLGKSFSGGRNFLGRVCIKGRGSGNKRLFRLVDLFKRISLFGVLCKLIYDSNRSAPFVCILYENGLVAYSILIEGLKIGSNIFTGYSLIGEVNSNNNLGWSVPICDVKLFSLVSNIESYPFLGSKVARAAGGCAVLIGKSQKKAVLKLRSGWLLYVSLGCFVTCGKISKRLYNSGDFGSAGKKRAFGFRPKVRGVAKNPCDHPHGGGNGKKSKPPVPVNAWGRFHKWAPTKATKSDYLKRRMFKCVK